MPEVIFTGPAGRLEGRYHPAKQKNAPIAMVLHPHPQFQGNMNHPIVYQVYYAFVARGFSVLRFNFRGVGASTGKHDDGIGERDDARVALEYLLADQPNAREVIVAGFSFGSIVGLNVGCADARVHRLIAIGVPARLGQLECLFDCAKPKLFIHGAEDVIAPLAPLEEFLAKLPANSNHRLVSLAGAGHFFDDQANELMQTIKDFVGEPV